VSLQPFSITLHTDETEKSTSLPSRAVTQEAQQGRRVSPGTFGAAQSLLPVASSVLTYAPAAVVTGPNMVAAHSTRRGREWAALLRGDPNWREDEHDGYALAQMDVQVRYCQFR
jgi:hypothetical protein